VPARHNPRLQALVDRINADEELRQLWRCANVNAVDRLGLSDHGEVHIRIVANAALRLLRLLHDAGCAPGIVAQHHLASEDAEVVVVVAAALHDLSLAIPGGDSDATGLGFAYLKARELLTGLYSVRERTIVIAEALHAIRAQDGVARCLTLEAGVLEIAEALDMAEGRSRLPTDHSGAQTPPAAVEEVKIMKGAQRPVRIELRMNSSAGLAQVDSLLKRALLHSTLAAWVEVVARIENNSDGMVISLTSESEP
jgi:hypothetical protein